MEPSGITPVRVTNRRRDPLIYKCGASTPSWRSPKLVLANQRRGRRDPPGNRAIASGKKISDGTIDGNKIGEATNSGAGVSLTTKSPSKKERNINNLENDDGYTPLDTPGGRKENESRFDYNVKYMSTEHFFGLGN